jgi:hypothetical protein
MIVKVLYRIGKSFAIMEKHYRAYGTRAPG